VPTRRARCYRRDAGAAPRSPRSVCYLTGLSHIDPLAGGLSMGRFLNPELTSLPDIDIDFPRDVREVLIRRVHERYGHDRAALVATSPAFARAARFASWARRWGCRRARSSASRAAQTGGSGHTPFEGKAIVASYTPSSATSPARWARVRTAVAGSGWRDSRRRRSGCRATSPSIRAG